MWLLIFMIFCGFSLGERCLNSDAIYFPDKMPSSADLAECVYSQKLLKSLQIARRLNTLDSVDDYRKLVAEGDPPFSLSSRFSEGVIMAQHAFCMPENQTVHLKNDPDLTFVYGPADTRVERCGGGCHSEYLSCQPSDYKVINMSVTKMSVQNNGFKYEGKIILPVEQHTKCKCLCKIKANQCTEKQEYIEDECRCKCRNLDEREECEMRKDSHKWDHEFCQCQEIISNQITIGRC